MEKKIETFEQLQQAIQENSERAGQIGRTLRKEYGNIQSWLSFNSNFLYWGGLALALYRRFFRK